MTNGIKSIGHFFWNFSSCPSINGLFAQSLRYAQKNNPRNITHMPVVIFFACLVLEQKSSFMDGHELTLISHKKFSAIPI